MDYLSLNEEHKKKLNSTIQDSLQFDWEDSELINILLGQLPKIRSTNYDDKLRDELKILRKVYCDFNYFLTQPEEFLRDIYQAIDSIESKYPQWNGLYRPQIELQLKMMKSTLIIGEGGIGKTYFISEYEKALCNKNIKHLCIYGKFFDTIDVIDISQIDSISKTQEFVFIVDAINEIDETQQEQLLGLIKSLYGNRGFRVIISYRTGTLSNSFEFKIKEIFNYIYSFPGVSFESALNTILKTSAADVFMYEDILYSNNPLQLRMLAKALADPDIINQLKNNICTLTYIYEKYIKDSIDHKKWKLTKRIVEKMYQKKSRFFTLDDIPAIDEERKCYISAMMQYKFISEYDTEEGPRYIFVIESLGDYLMVRSILKDLKGKSLDEVVTLIKTMTDCMHGLEEPLILMLFDKYQNDFVTINHVLNQTGLNEFLSPRTMLKIHFGDNNIQNIQSLFPYNIECSFLTIMGGYVKKPFNCTNFYNDYLWANPIEQKHMLSSMLQRDVNNVSGRLKNLAYYTVLARTDEVRDKESISFAIWMSASPNSTIRLLAEKLMFEVINKNRTQISFVTENYKKYEDLYIRESIIKVLGCFKGDARIQVLFTDIVNDYKYTSARALKEIANYLGCSNDYINWNKINYYSDADIEINETLNKILLLSDIYDKDFLPFRYWGPDHIDYYHPFLITDKKVVTKFNKELQEKYSCVRTGECNGWSGFFDSIKTDTSVERTTMNKKAMIVSLGKLLREIYSSYQLEFNGDSENLNHLNYLFSLERKCLDLACDLFFGSLMTNYYLDDLSTYNNYHDTIGYDLYDPSPYEEGDNLNAPLPIFQTDVEQIGNKIIGIISDTYEKDEKWVNNLELTIKKVKMLSEPVIYKHEEWYILATRINLYERNKYDGDLWNEHIDFWCCSSDEMTLSGEETDRYLTIELKNYCGHIDKYAVDSPYKNECLRVPNISSNGNDVFDDSSLVLPPADIISKLGLSYDYSTSMWRDSNDECVIICSNNKNSYYSDFYGSGVYIKKPYLEKYIDIIKHPIKFFVYTEKFLPSTGFSDETSVHIELIDHDVVRVFKNSEERMRSAISNNQCKKCKYGLYDTEEDDIETDFSVYDELIKRYKGEYNL